MADDLEEVRQRFEADLSDYIRPIEEAADQTEAFAESVRDATGDLFALAAAASAAGMSLKEFAAQEKELADLTDRNSQEFQRNWDANRRAVLRGHDALLQAARAELDINREAEKLSKIERDMSGGGRGGLLTRLLYGSDFAGGGNNVGGLFGAGSGLSGGMLGGIAAAVPAAEALLVEVTALASGFAAAGAGAAAFYALSHNALTQLQSDVGKLQSGQEAVQLAQNLEKLYPTPAHLKALDAAKEKLKALQLSMGQDAGPAAQAMQQMGNEWHNLQAAFAPTSFKVLGEAFTVVKDALPAILPLAQAFAGAITPLLGKLDTFVKSSGFHDWLKKFTSLVGPATSAIGQGIGDVVSNFGKLFTLMSAKDVVNAINIAFRILSGTITGLVWVISHMMHSWDEFSGAIVRGWQNVRQWSLDAWHAIDQVFHNIAHAYDNVVHAGDAFSAGVARVFKDIGSFIARFFTVDIPHWFDIGVNWFKGLPGRILRALGDLGHLLWNAGKSLISGLINGIESMVPGLHSVVSGLGSAISSVWSWVTGSHSPSLVFHKHGQDLVQGLIDGIQSKRNELLQVIRNLGTGTTAALTGTASPAIVHHNMTVDLANVMSLPAAQQALQRHVQAAVLEFANQNSGSLMVLPGRRS